ncbi:MAG: gamma carbonic anhydrase family protein [Candidatus Eisenbacteria bacterium]
MVDWKSNLRETPRLGKGVYIAPSATLVGRVEIGDNSSIWPNVSCRGDVHWMRIGTRTNIQDNTVLHVTIDTHPLVIGNDVTVGHGSVIHGCTIKDRCLIGMGSVILDGAVVGPDAIVGAGSVVKQGGVVEPRTLSLGVPAVYRRDLTGEEIAAILESADMYHEYALEYLNLSM